MRVGWENVLAVAVAISLIVLLTRWDRVVALVASLPAEALGLLIFGIALVPIAIIVKAFDLTVL